MSKTILALATMLVLAGCFNPTYPENLPCSEADTCPPSQQCDLSTGICRKQMPPIDPDARVSEPIDAPVSEPIDAGVPDAVTRCEERGQCQAGQVCELDRGECVVASCTDTAQNGNETDIDCGGSDCPRCAAGARCELPSDCLNDACNDGRCVPELCGNGTVDPDEACDDGGESATCDADCTPVECRDGVRNATAGEECDDGNASNNDNCTNECRLASCSDGFRNADELDVDCGGHCGPRSCRVGQSCGDSADCDSDFCDDNTCTYPAKLVFVSSELYNGDMGGLAGADARCQGLADAAGLPGTYRAWLSSTTESPSTRFIQSEGPYVLVNGTLIANSWTDLTDGALANPINLTERGTAPPASFSLCSGETTGVWSGTRPNGSIISTNRCQDWTAATVSVGGHWGNSTRSTNAQWSDWCYGGSCDWLASIYCFQQ